jgi:energy-converting hydrogenase Eha subunit A
VAGGSRSLIFVSCLPKAAASLAVPAVWLYASAMTAEGEGGSGAAVPASDTPVADVPALDAPAPDGAARRVADGIASLERAVAALTEAAESGDADVAPLAIELLARTLPLCEREEEAAQVWQHGLDHPDPVIAAGVRERLRRAFGSDEPSWWEGFVEAAVCHSTLPLLTNEVFGALDHMYALAAVPLARGGARSRELRDVLAQAVRVPTGYVWGADLLASFRARFRDLTGTDTADFDE